MLWFYVQICDIAIMMWFMSKVESQLKWSLIWERKLNYNAALRGSCVSPDIVIFMITLISTVIISSRCSDPSSGLMLHQFSSDYSQNLYFCCFIFCEDWLILIKLFVVVTNWFVRYIFSHDKHRKVDKRYKLNTLALINMNHLDHWSHNSNEKYCTVVCRWLPSIVFKSVSLW